MILVMIILPDFCILKSLVTHRNEAKFPCHFGKTVEIAEIFVKCFVILVVVLLDFRIFKATITHRNGAYFFFPWPWEIVEVGLFFDHSDSFTTPPHLESHYHP